jgi:uncharacterized protein YlxW (UPF0749 family)
VQKSECGTTFYQALLATSREEVAVVVSDVTRIGDRVNVVEAAARNLAARVDTVEASMDELRAIVSTHELEMKVSIALTDRDQRCGHRNSLGT